MSLIEQGLSLSIAGISITFAALGLLVLVMMVLDRLFRVGPSVSDDVEWEETPVVSTSTRDTNEEEVVAAIAGVLAYLRSLEIRQSSLGTVLEAGRGSWWSMGQIERRALNNLSLGGTSHHSGTPRTP